MINGKMHCVHIKLYHMYILCDKLHWKCVTTHISTQDWLRFFNYELKWTSFILYFQKNYQKKKDDQTKILQFRYNETIWYDEQIEKWTMKRMKCIYH